MGVDLANATLPEVAPEEPDQRLVRGAPHEIVSVAAIFLGGGVRLLPPFGDVAPL